MSDPNRVGAGGLVVLSALVFAACGGIDQVKVIVTDPGASGSGDAGDTSTTGGMSQGGSTQAGTSGGRSTGGTGGDQLGAAGEGGAPDGSSGSIGTGGTGGKGGSSGSSGSSGSGGSGGSTLLSPDTTLSSTPPNPDNTAMPSFSFTSSITGSTFQCKLDAGNFGACTSPRIVTITGEGAHTFSVEATANGQTDPTPATYTWVYDITPPAVSITVKPAAVTSATSADFTFTSETGSKVACKLDAGAFGPCTTGTTESLTGLATGSHTFTVRASDAANNQATASYDWFIEPPCSPVDIVEAETIPESASWGTTFGSVLHGGNARYANGINSPFDFVFTGKGLKLYGSKGPATAFGNFTLSVDGSTPVTIDVTDPNGFSYQQLLFTTSGLANKSHSVEIICKKSECVIDYWSVTCN